MLAITGATGFTGKFVLGMLKEKYPSKQVKILVRDETKLSQVSSFINEYVTGDITNEKVLDQLLSGADTCVHLVNIRYSPKVMDVAQRNNVKHVIYVHTTGMFSKFRSLSEEYRRIDKLIQEQSKNNYTILRPTMIYGGLEDQNMHKLIRYLNKFPVFPVFGDGTSLMQPVYVGDLAQSIVNCVDNPASYNNAFNISGGSVHTYNEIIKIISTTLGKRVKTIHIPTKISLQLLQLYNTLLPTIVTEEQVLRLTEDKAISFDEAREAISYMPRSFAEGIRLEIEEVVGNHLGQKK